MKHETPDELDVYFEREELDPSEYKAFWVAYWNTDESLDELLDRFYLPPLDELQEEIIEEQATLDHFRAKITPRQSPETERVDQ